MDLYMEAKKLATRPYTIHVVKDLTTLGDAVYLASSPELDGCMGQGKTVQAAISDLSAARIDFIQCLLEDDLPVPAPQTYSTYTTSGHSTTYTNIRVSTLLTSKFDVVNSDPVASKAVHLVGVSLGM